MGRPSAQWDERQHVYICTWICTCNCVHISAPLLNIWLVSKQQAGNCVLTVVCTQIAHCNRMSAWLHSLLYFEL
jgi:hypothetical protein